MSHRLSYEAVCCRLGSRRGAVAALRDFSLRCEAGEPTCLVGPNGAGKSTALALAAGLMTTTAGRISFDGHGVTTTTPPRRLGYLPQASAFPSRLTVAEVLEFTAAARGAGGATLQGACLSGGFEPLRDRFVGALSSGWLRRLGLAVALMPPADLLLLDEPFVGLDLETLDSVVTELGRRVAEGAALVLCSHDFEVIDRLGARVAVLDEGRLLGVDGPGQEGARAVYRRTLMEAVASGRGAISMAGATGDAGAAPKERGLHAAAG